MTIHGAIELLDEQIHNTYSDTDKIRWLSRLDGMVKQFIIDTHSGGEDVEFSGYDETDMETELLVAHPHDNIYLRWMETQIHYLNHEYDKYNNAMDVFQTEYTAFERYYNRTHMPKGNNFKYM